MGSYACSELGGENILQDCRDCSDNPACSHFFPIHFIPLILLVALVTVALHSFGALHERFLSSVSAKIPISSISPLNESGVISEEQPSIQPQDAAEYLNLTAFTPEVQRWGAQINRWAQAYDLPPELIAIVMQIESCGDPTAVSIAGARGLFQVMPFHFGVGEDWREPEVNASRGMAYLARSYQLGNGQIDLTLAGYNGGHSVIGRHPSTWSAETRRYVYWGSGIWSDLASKKVSSPTLNEWLLAGGDHLCTKAADVSMFSYSQNRHSDNGFSPTG